MPLRFTLRSKKPFFIALLSFAPTLWLTGCSPTGSGTMTDLTPTAVTLKASAILLSSGSPLTLTGTIAPSAAPGNVTFFDGTTGIGVSTLSSGTATLALSTLAVGTHSISVGYGGSSGYYASNSGTITVTVM